MKPTLSPYALEEATLATWRAREDESHFGWRFLAEDGATGRVNAVWPLEWHASQDLNTAIAVAEQWCRARDLNPCFKLADTAFAPANLPQALLERGYAEKSRTLVMTRQLSPAGPQQAAGVSLQSAPTGTFDTALTAASTNPKDLAERRQVLARIPAPRAFAVLTEGTETAAIGAVAIAPDGLAGIYAMRTVPAFQRRGFASQVLGALAAFAAGKSATTLFLQVEANNTPAIRLYEKADFQIAYAYSYWHAPDQP
jgi:ribosomal protein S18 acetylase RimI-like enzyme